MPFWLLEVLQVAILVALALGLQRVIRRSGTAYVDELFEHSPRIGSGFVLLSDIGFYLIFSAYALFNVDVQTDHTMARAGDLGELIGSIAGIALVIGMLHILNIVFLPLLAGLLGRGGGTRAAGDRLEGRLGALNVTVTLQGG